MPKRLLTLPWSAIEQAISEWDDLAGIDLHGLESLPLKIDIALLAKKAKANGLTVKAHAGEFGPAGNVSHAIDQLGVRRVQHGVRAVESEDVLSRIVDSGTTLDVCPISNYKLRVVKDWIDHPLKQFDLGISCTISRDDPFSFDNTLCEEYLVCMDQLGARSLMSDVLLVWDLRWQIWIYRRNAWLKLKFQKKSPLT